MTDITMIIGPTAIGKTDYSIELALKTGAHVISADAFQVYRKMDIGTGKVSQEIRHKIPHYLIDIKDPDEDYNVAEFIERSHQIIMDLRKKSVPIIICGGTAFYQCAFLFNYEFPKTAQSDMKYRDTLYQRLDQIGSDQFWTELSRIDPEAAQRIEKNDIKKLIRAHEIYYQTGKPPSEVRKRANTPRSDVVVIGLTAPRAKIYENINSRVDQMLEVGLIEEVKLLWEQGVAQSNSMQALGYKETVQYLEGNIDRNKMIELIKQKTRNFAKRQLTWYKRFENVRWIQNS